MEYLKEYICKIGEAIGAAAIGILGFMIACKIYDMFSGVM